MEEVGHDIRMNRGNTQIGFTGFVLLSCLAFRCVLAISRQSILQRAQAREGEAEKL